MKKLSNILFVGGIIFIAFIIPGCKAKELSATDMAKMELLAKKIEVQDYTFRAQTANPLNFRTVNLDPSYTLRVTKDTIQAYLPYFGRAYTAPMDPTEGGIKFTSTKFTYNIKEKKGTWEVSIDTKDTNGNIKLFLSIGKSGYTNLNVADTNRQSISFYGIIDNEK